VQVGYHDINLDTTGKDYPMLAGNLASILISAFICITVSLIKPDNFDWEATRNLKMVEEEWTGAQRVQSIACIATSSKSV
jgi:urea-proton symporter